MPRHSTTSPTPRAPFRRTLATAAALTALAVLLPVPLAAQATARASITDTLALSLADAVTRALRTGDEAGVARAQVEIASAQLTIARASALPQLRLNATYGRFFQNARAQVAGQAFNQPNTYNVNANLSQNLFSGGRIVAGYRAARRLRGAAELTEAEAQASVSLDVQRAYLDALLADRLAVLQTQNATLADSRVTLVAQLESGGRASRYDVLRARVERANLQPGILEAQNTRDLALLELKRLANIPAEQPLVLVTAIDAGGAVAVLAAVESEAGVPNSDVVRQPAAAASTLATDSAGRSLPPMVLDTLSGRDRASVRAAELIARARRDAVSIARADLLPTLSVFVQSGYQAFPLTGSPLRNGAVDPVDCPPGSEVDRVCTRQNGGFFADRQLGVQLSWPLFDGLRVKGAIDLAQANARIAELLAAQERERASVEVAQARAELTRARAQFSAGRETIGEADEAFRLASLRFTRGLGTQLDVSDAQFALLTAQSNEARATYDLYFAAASLARALGRPVPLPPVTTPSPAPLRTTAIPAASALTLPTQPASSTTSPDSYRAPSSPATP